MSESMERFDYRVDAGDRIRFVSDAWIRFARDNGAPELDRDTVYGISIWRFIDGAQARHLYRLLFERARCALGVYTVPFRCDGPHVRRRMELTIEGHADGSVHLSSTLLAEEPRAPVTLLDPDTLRGAELLHMCSWCKRVLVEGLGWMEIEDAVARLGLFRAPVPRVTHGVCSACTELLEAS